MCKNARFTPPGVQKRKKKFCKNRSQWTGPTCLSVRLSAAPCVNGWLFFDAVFCSGRGIRSSCAFSVWEATSFVSCTRKSKKMVLPPNSHVFLKECGKRVDPACYISFDRIFNAVSESVFRFELRPSVEEFRGMMTSQNEFSLQKPKPFMSYIGLKDFSCWFWICYQNRCTTFRWGVVRCGPLMKSQNKNTQWSSASSNGWLRVIAGDLKGRRQVSTMSYSQLLVGQWEAKRGLAETIFCNSTQDLRCCISIDRSWLDKAFWVGLVTLRDVTRAIWAKNRFVSSWDPYTRRVVLGERAGCD